MSENVQTGSFSVMCGTGSGLCYFVNSVLLTSV
jgi:hypothetical protein